MSLTIAHLNINPAGGTNMVLGPLRLSANTITMDASYPAGGEPLTAADLGLNAVLFAIVNVHVAGTGSVVAGRYSTSTNSLLAYTATGEVADTTDLSAIQFRVYAFGY